MNFLELKVRPPLVVLIVGGLMWAIAKLGPLLAVPDTVRIVAAFVFIAAGVAVATAGVVSFRSAETTTNPAEPERATSLVSSGIYAVTRNPMYLGWLLLLLGWATYLASPAALIGPLGFWVYINRFQIIPEERALAKVFGSSFTTYAAKVRRWL